MNSMNETSKNLQSYLPITNLTWQNVVDLAQNVWNEIQIGLTHNILLSERWKNRFVPILYAYPIPTGGVYAAQAVATQAAKCKTTIELVSEPKNADVYIDDVIDSGNTRLRTFRVYGEKPFYSLIDKTLPDNKYDWIVFPWESMKNETGPEDAVRRLLQFVGEDPTREGLKETPSRVVNSLGELCWGYNKEPQEVFKTFSSEGCDEMVLLRDIEFTSMCEHHILPFTGIAHIAYIPNGKVIGVSKLARLLEIFSRRLQIQEKLTVQITHSLMDNLKPKGAACVLEAMHCCMSCRGVKKGTARMITSSLEGVFRDDARARSEFLSMIKR